MVSTGTFYFDPKDNIYADHFPGNPVVPGSVIIDAFFKAYLKYYNTDIKLKTVQDFRFKKFISPGPYEYSLSVNDKFVDCRLFKNSKTVVSGKICL